MAEWFKATDLRPVIYDAWEKKEYYRTSTSPSKYFFFGIKKIEKLFLEFMKRTKA